VLRLAPYAAERLGLLCCRHRRRRHAPPSGHSEAAADDACDKLHPWSSASFFCRLRRCASRRAADDLCTLLGCKSCRDFAHKRTRGGAGDCAACLCRATGTSGSAHDHLRDALNRRLRFRHPGFGEKRLERLRRLLDVRPERAVRKVNKWRDRKLSKRHRASAELCAFDCAGDDAERTSGEAARYAAKNAAARKASGDGPRATADGAEKALCRRLFNDLSCARREPRRRTSAGRHERRLDADRSGLGAVLRVRLARALELGSRARLRPRRVSRLRCRADLLGRCARRTFEPELRAVGRGDVVDGHQSPSVV
jgi:hypothetical protein